MLSIKQTALRNGEEFILGHPIMWDCGQHIVSEWLSLLKYGVGVTPPVKCFWHETITLPPAQDSTYDFMHNPIQIIHKYVTQWNNSKIC